MIEWRGIAAAILTEPGFAKLPPGAKLLWFILRLLLGPSGLRSVPAADATLQEMSGLSAGEVRVALRALVKAGRLKRDRNVLFLVEALRLERSMSPNNSRQLTCITDEVSKVHFSALAPLFWSLYPDWDSAGLGLQPGSSGMHGAERGEGKAGDAGTSRVARRGGPVPRSRGGAAPRLPRALKRASEGLPRALEGAREGLRSPFEGGPKGLGSTDTDTETGTGTETPNNTVTETDTATEASRGGERGLGAPSPPRGQTPGWREALGDAGVRPPAPVGRGASP